MHGNNHVRHDYIHVFLCLRRVYSIIAADRYHQYVDRSDTFGKSDRTLFAYIAHMTEIHAVHTIFKKYSCRLFFLPDLSS